MILAIIMFLIAVFAWILSIRSFLEKGFLLNNAYIYASKSEREKMDKKPHYRQSAVVFLLLGMVFALNGFAALFHVDWIYTLVIVCIISTIIYAIVSSIANK